MEGFTVLGYEGEDIPSISRVVKFTRLEGGAEVRHGETIESSFQGGDAKVWKQQHAS